MTRSALRCALAIITACGGVAACQPGGESGSDAATDAIEGAPPVVEVTAVDYAFAAPDTLSAGWTTFRLRNQGEETHFFIFDRVPEGRTLEDFMTEVAPPFDSVWYRLRDGEIGKQEAGVALFAALPEWFASVERMGGTGLVGPGLVAQTTLELEPGTYVMECYVKTPDGEFHASIGMAKELTVTDASTEASPPEADVELTLWNDSIVVDGDVEAGRQTFAVHFAEHPDAGLGNDIHLVRLDGEATAETLVPWMDWMNVEGLAAPAPATFLGGTQEMPVEHTAYFTVELEPGRYAWITESAETTVKTSAFTVP